ncbi:hypothetical protein AMATHDRAFT_165583 [Amanita thiersii Skay4041]|uniref:Maf-like protein n=1 Tax=Amanita thiersii Skay4041 TaxID=703135 RepID=A0A2A9NAX3_9AGAR|nr:hypothetical protein AMATHDRAFT_165583 [Amanita thiersii Skay4041]
MTEWPPVDTIVLTHVQTLTSQTDYSILPDYKQELLEKPASKADNMHMLLNLNRNICKVVTGVTVGIRSIDERTLVYFADSPKHLLEAYIESSKCIDRAGGFAIQGLGGLLIRKVEGDYNNVVGFLATSFFNLLNLLVDEDPDFLDI